MFDPHDIRATRFPRPLRLGESALLAAGLAAVLSVGFAAPAFAQRGTDSGMICPGDARCPAAAPAMALGAPPEDFRPAATQAGVNDGQLEVRTYETNPTGQAGALIVTSNTPVPNPESTRRRRAAEPER